MGFGIKQVDNQVIITSVKPGSPAALHGVSSGMRVALADGKPVTTKNVLKSMKKKIKKNE